MDKNPKHFGFLFCPTPLGKLTYLSFGILFKKSAKPCLFLYIFVLFTWQIPLNDKSVHGVLGTQTWGGRMVGHRQIHLSYGGTLFVILWIDWKIFTFHQWSFFFKMGQLRPLYRLFSVFSNKIITIFTTDQWEKCHVHPVYGAGIWTHDLRNVSLLP